MNDIRDALRKAGLVNKKDEKRFSHEEKVRKKQLGREGRNQQQLDQIETQKQRRHQTKAEIQAAQKIHDQRVNAQQRERKLLADLESRALRNLAGSRRFHYRDRQAYLPYLAVSPEASRRLEAGEYAIVEAPGHPGRILVVPREVAAELKHRHADCVLHLSGR